MKHLLLSSGINLSNLKSSSAFIFLAAFFAPIKASMIAVGVIITLDFIFGLMAAKKRKEKIESKKMSRTLVKMLVYQLLVISAHLCEHYLVDFIPFTQITLGFIAIIEFYSIGEAFTTITGENFISYAKSIIMAKLKDKFPEVNDDFKNNDESNI
jgi:phage-related holin